ncbi:MAG: GFA family protein [Pseudomonadota bacterium]
MHHARCYCGKTSFEFADEPLAIAYCHCVDCRRWTGAVVSGFAAVAPRTLPNLGPPTTEINGVRRWTCADCASPLAAAFDYLPDQIYVPLGLFDDLDRLQPQVHCHADAAPRWLHIDDTLPRHTGSARDMLNRSAP